MNEGRLRAAVIGAGWYAAENHIPALARRGEVALDAVCRLGRDELERVRDHFGFVCADEDHRAVLERRPDIVVVASPHVRHYEHVRDALEAGAHVLCEKPLTLDPERLGRHLLIANGYHYLPRMAEVAELIRGGAVGTIEQVGCQFSSATRQVFSGTVGFERWNLAFFRPAISTWQDPAGGGGFAYGQLSHSIALMLWLTGLRAAEVTARAFAPERIDLHDVATVLFEGGAIGAVFGGASVPEGGRARLRLSIAGSAGIADIDVDLDRCEIHRHDGSVSRIPLAAGAWTYNCAGPVDALVDLALGEGRNLSPAAVGAATTGLIAAMSRSAAADGARVQLARPGHLIERP
jgi:predicted dehydrogenase